MTDKFSETEILSELSEYIAHTYGEHYATANKPDNIQVLDLFEDHENEAFCKINAVKYLKRFGIKNGRNLRDLTKAAHYIVMMTHFARKINGEAGEPIDESPTERTSRRIAPAVMALSRDGIPLRF